MHDKYFTRAETFAGENFRVFFFWSFFLKVYAFRNFKSTKRKSFLREIMDIFQNAKVFFTIKNYKTGQSQR